MKKFVPFYILFFVILTACGPLAVSDSPEPVATSTPTISLVWMSEDYVPPFTNHEVRDAWAGLAGGGANNVVKVCSPLIPLVEIGAGCITPATSCVIEASPAKALGEDISSDCYRLGGYLMSLGNLMP